MRHGSAGRAEHGVTTPAILLTNSLQLAKETLSEVERLLEKLPTADIARQSWQDYGKSSSATATMRCCWRQIVSLPNMFR